MTEDKAEALVGQIWREHMAAPRPLEVAQRRARQLRADADAARRAWHLADALAEVAAAELALLKHADR